MKIKIEIENVKRSIQKTHFVNSNLFLFFFFFSKPLIIAVPIYHID